MAPDNPEQRLTPKTSSLRVFGLGLFGGGGCLMWTIVLIPVAIPMAIVGAIMFIASFFQKHETAACMACGQSLTIEPAVNVLVCPHCQKAMKRTEDRAGWERVP